ncbi:mechanosensitive ion channel family protein [Oceanispirochaeta crateris]|uniref:Mechanosensitive ion channel family protein n=2 Tax=Oceanispirochaeta crateris TaxID=2518645 RepID=A0A5C1QN23_9SPIO|nr:mechanosensitive ion channel family protein [Oceanispirochaeta crateris]
MEILPMESIKDFFNSISYGQLFRIAILMLSGVLIIRTIRFFMDRTFFKKSNLQNKMLISKLVNYSGFLILFIIILSELGIKLSALLGAAGIIGIAVGVASQKSLGNIISGFFMVTEKSFEIGDVITVGDKTGTVYSVELLSIMLKTFDNLLIRIPNETLISTDVINITRFPIRRMDLYLRVAYDSDLSLVKEVLQTVAKCNVNCLDEPNPFILIKTFEESGIGIQYGIWFEKTNYVETRNTIVQDVLAGFKSAGIVIPYPHITVTNPLPVSEQESP